MLLTGGFNNIVELNQHGLVVKKYIPTDRTILSSVERQKREKNALIKFGGVIAPSLIKIDRSLTYQTYIKGKLISDILLNTKISDELLTQIGQVLHFIHGPIRPTKVNLMIEFNKQLRKYKDSALPILESYKINLSKVEKNLNFDWSHVEKLGNRFIHGDYCFINILLTSNGLRVIDWEYSGGGSPYDDFAQFTIFSLKKFNLDGKFFWLGYGLSPNDKVLNGFITKRILTYMGKMGKKVFDQKYKEGIFFPKHILNVLREITSNPN
jgi:thiamine kinase-like enzyme